MDRENARALLITGVYGSGKSTVLEETATILEERSIPYAVLDLDWLSWFDAGWDDDEAEFALMLRNLEAVVANYLSAGIRLFGLALSIESERERDAIARAMGMPMYVVRLSVPIETVTERIGDDVTTGRKVDLHWANVWLEGGIGVGLEDTVVANDRPVRDVALDVIETAGWDR